jgi:protein phosphatase
MPFHVELEFASKTDTGLVRSQNEDAIAISAQCGFAILADGMGGYNAGEVASQIATSVLKEALEERLLNKPWYSRFNRSRRLHQLIAESIMHANASIIEAARLEPTYSGMGTTLVVAMFHGDKVAIAHIGDSRVYRLRNNEIRQLTRDHSLLQEHIDAGLLTEEEAQFSHNRNLITRALGVNYEIEIEIHDYITETNDMYILCSDGLSDMLSNADIVQILNDKKIQLADACEALVQTANLRGGRDNISVVSIRALPPQGHSDDLIARITRWLKHIKLLQN